MKKLNLDYYIIHASDEYQSEFVLPEESRLAWLTGFSGSAGVAGSSFRPQVIVGQEQAALFVDGRYIVEANETVDRSLFSVFLNTEKSPIQWLAEVFREDQVIGYDSRIATTQEAERVHQQATRKGGNANAVNENLVDQVWANRPSKEYESIERHPLQYAGTDHREKLKTLSKILQAAHLDAILLTRGEEIAWALNVRAWDHPYTPAPHAIALIMANGNAHLFLHESRIAGARESIGDEYTQVHAFFALPATLEEHLTRGAKVGIDQNTAPKQYVDICKNQKLQVIQIDSRIEPMMATKNSAEAEGARDAHLRDGIAKTRFLHWLTKHMKPGLDDEATVAEVLEGFRREDDLFRGNSFPYVTASGPNGAMIHYRPSNYSPRKLQHGDIYLIDSGGQYLCGTTDVTRTVLLGPEVPANSNVKRDFTLVLKGHIALSSAVFPLGTPGSQLDTLARKDLWAHGLDYAHGTGHGVGSYLSVHEGPHNISQRPDRVPLEAGMIVSIEPGTTTQATMEYERKI